MNHVDIKLNYTSVVNFAMQQNHVPVVREIVITNNGTDSLTDIDVIIIIVIRKRGYP